MKPSLSYLMICATILASAMLLNSNAGNADQKTPGLPGARPEIDASQYPSLQAAFDALPVTGGVVRLPAGEFTISKPLVITQEDVLITGAGTATHIKNENENGEPGLMIHPNPDSSEEKPRIWRVQLQNFRITGNEKSGHGILAKHVQEIFIHGVTVSYHGGDGIQLDHCFEDPRVCDSLFTYNKKIGLHLIGCHDIIVSANQFEENLDALHCIDGFNLCMTGNNIDDHLQHGVVIENTYGSVLSGNMIEECKNWAVILDRDCYGNTISANVIAHNGTGIDLRDAHGCAVSANTFTLMGEHAVRIGPNSGRITLTGNNFSNSFIGEASVKRRKNDLAAAGLTLDGTKDVVISGNVFSSVKPKAVEVVQPSTRILFTDNVLTDVESDHGKLQESRIDNILHGSAPSEK